MISVCCEDGQKKEQVFIKRPDIILHYDTQFGIIKISPVAEKVDA